MNDFFDFILQKEEKPKFIPLYLEIDNPIYQKENKNIDEEEKKEKVIIIDIL
jgi:hypothetical protein